MTFRELVERLEKNGNNLADIAVGRMMEIIFENTGTFPYWEDEAPWWVISNCIKGAKK